MAKNSDKTPKYNFGLLETPSPMGMADRRGAGSSSCNRTAATSASTSSSTMMEQQGTTSSSFRTPRDPPPSSSLSSRTPGTGLRTPGTGLRTPGTGLRTPRRGPQRTPVTSSTSTPFATPLAPPPSVIVAVVEGRGLARGEIGMSSLDLRHPALVLSQFADTQTYVRTLTRLQLLHPVEILLPNTVCEGDKTSKLFRLISEHFPSVSISTVQRKYFNETKGLQYIKQLCLPDYSIVEMDVSSKYYSLATTAALLKYIEFIQSVVFAPASLKIVFKGSEHTTMIDTATTRNLELLQNLRHPRSPHTLFGVLNYTHTSAGARLLRANILQPPSDLETISLRQEAVLELTSKEDLFFGLKSIIRNCLEVDHVVSLCVQLPRHESVKTAENTITSVIYLKHMLELVGPLRECLKDCENPLFMAFCKSLEDSRFELIMSKINSIIDNDIKYQKGVLNMRTQKCFAVKPHINGLLDVARRTYTEIVEDITQLVQQLGERFGLPLRTAYSQARGFYVQLSGRQYRKDSLPSLFVKVTRMKNTLSCTTADLIKLNDRTKSSLQETYLMTNIVVKELLADIRPYTGCLYKLSECVAMLDMIVSFAHACTVSEYVKPEFTDTLAIKQGRHPILEKIGSQPVVPNNTYASEENNFIIITGPNMSGKSTYLRQVALLQVMAQLGSFVPAQYASFRLASQVFSRLGSDDDMETNASTFMLEMREIHYIMQNATNDSLIIIDELGRGTSAEEGVGICHAICEYLLQLKAFTCFVTHFLELANLDNLYPNVENYYFEVQRTFSTEARCEKVHYTHVLSRGRTAARHYGLQLAELSTIPQSVVQEARQRVLALEQQQQSGEGEGEPARRRRAVFKLATRLRQTARCSRLETPALRTYLATLRRHFLKEVASPAPTSRQASSTGGTPAPQSSSTVDTPAPQSSSRGGTPAPPRGQSSSMRGTPAPQSSSTRGTPAPQSSSRGGTPAPPSRQSFSTGGPPSPSWKQSSSTGDTSTHQSSSIAGTPAHPRSQGFSTDNYLAPQSSSIADTPAPQSSPSGGTPAPHRRQSFTADGTPTTYRGQSSSTGGTPAPQSSSTGGTPAPHKGLSFSAGSNPGAQPSSTGGTPEPPWKQPSSTGGTPEPPWKQSSSTGGTPAHQSLSTGDNPAH